MKRLTPLVAALILLAGPALAQGEEGFAAATLENGVSIAFGTDCGVSPHGENGREFADWLASGFDDAREFMGSFIGDEEADTNDLGEIPIPSVGPEADPDLLPQVEDPPPPVDDGDGSVQG